MKILAMVAIAVMGVSASTGEGKPAPERRVTVCMDPGDVLANSARLIAAKIFQRIGVRIEWRRAGRECPLVSGVIVVSLSQNPSEGKLRHPLAYALPFEGTHIVVFYNQVWETVGNERDRVPRLLAYVLVHEITHILQGVEHHSESGIMKANWKPGDNFDIQRESFAFAKEDVDLIYYGLEWREARRAAANSISSPVRRPALFR